MQWLHRYHQLGCRTVGAGDHAAVLQRCSGIDLWHHQWDVRVHSPLSALVHHDDPRVACPGDQIGGHFIGSAGDQQVQAGEGFASQFLDLV